MSLELKQIPAYVEAFKLMVAGYSVIPLGKDKKPLLKSWMEFQERAATEDEIAQWFTNWPHANVGIVCGKISGISVVDVDTGGDSSQFPVTKMVRTANGGMHFYYEYSPEAHTSVDQERHVDVRSDGGYVVAPPSQIIRKDGELGSYEVIFDVPLRPFPVELFATQKPRRDWKEVVGKGVSAGGRNNTMAAVFGRYMGLIPPQEWEELVWPIGMQINAKNNPPLSERELRTIFDSIGKRAINDRRGPQQDVNKDGQVPVVSLYEAAQEQMKNPRSMIPTGFKEIDKALGGGFSSGDLIVITGPTGNGKTLFGQSITFNMTEAGFPVLWFSYEVMLEELWQKFKDMGVNDTMIGYSPMKMQSGETKWIHDKILEAMEKFSVKVVFIDHLGFIEKKIQGPDRAQNHSAYLGSLCRELKTIALDTGVTVVLLAHTRKTYGKDVTVEDIGFSAGIGQESDAVLTVKRKQLKKKDDFGDEYLEMAPETIINLAKNRRKGSQVRVTATLKNGKFDDGEMKLGGAVTVQSSADLAEKSKKQLEAMQEAPAEINLPG